MGYDPTLGVLCYLMEIQSRNRLGFGTREFLWTKLDLKELGGSSCGCNHIRPLGVIVCLLTYIYAEILG